MVREHLGAVVAPVRSERLDPLGGGAVQVDTARARDLPVRDVADEQVQERVLRLARNGGAAVAADELLPLESVQWLLERGRRRTTDCGERRGPVDLAEHRSDLDELLLLGRERVEAGC